MSICSVEKTYLHIHSCPSVICIEYLRVFTNIYRKNNILIRKTVQNKPKTKIIGG